MKVLLVDDDPIQRMLLVDLLHRFEKVEIVQAADGDEAWKELESGLCPVLCCCDMRMPGMSGIELLRRFKSRPALAEVPFVFFSAATDRNTIEDAIAAGATGYILKPFDLRGARSKLEKVFHGIRERYCEETRVTQKRLGVPPEKLLGYFDAFKNQLADSGPSMQEQSADGKNTPPGARFDNLQASCAALGLWHAARMIEYARSMKPDVVERILQDVATIIDQQVLRARAEFGIRESPALKANEKPAQDNEPAAAPVATTEPDDEPGA